jgi:hypothetical protein
MRYAILPAVLLLVACADGGVPAGPNPAPPAGPPTSSGPNPRIGGCDIFPADNAWNRNVSGDPVDPAPMR